MKLTAKARAERLAVAGMAYQRGQDDAWSALKLAIALADKHSEQH